MMELAEVVNPNVAVPVVGVILCCVLVYAFGFKSPVQPPSFLDEDDSKKPKTKSKHKKKSQPNGQIVATAQPHQVPARQTPSGRQTVTPDTPNTKMAKKQQAKSPKPQKAAKNDTMAEPVTGPSEDNEGAGEWLTAQSKKKNKRNKKGQDDGGKKETATTPRQEEVKTATTPRQEVKTATTPRQEEVKTATTPRQEEVKTATTPRQEEVKTATTPQQEEVKTDSEGAASEVVKGAASEVLVKRADKGDATVAEPEVVTTAPPVEKKQKKRKDMKSAVKVEASNGAEEKAVKSDLSAETALGDTLHMQIKESVAPQEKQKTRKESKKGKKTAACVSETASTDVTVNRDAQLEHQRPGMEAELIAAMEDDTTAPPDEVAQKEAPDETDTKSSKASKKKKSKESRDKFLEKKSVSAKGESTESAGQTRSSADQTISSAGQTTSSAGQTTVSRASNKDTTEQTYSSDQPQSASVTTIGVTDGTVDSSSKTQEPSAVTFDELGAWQEAKPVKSKKKRARRDN